MWTPLQRAGVLGAGMGRQIEDGPGGTVFEREA